MIYSFGRDIMFMVLALIAALALISMHPIISAVFVVLAIVYVVFEYDIAEYVKNA
ncbi:hypothetical protein ACFL0V_05460 [Nanoarchaeota archaeon]